MRHYIIILLTMLILSENCHGQRNEFETYANGLIYDEATMQRLGTIVDSLNIKFRACDLSHPYYSYPQGVASLIQINNKSVKKMIEEGVSLADFTKKYPRAVKERIWIVKTCYKDYDDDMYVEYAGLPYGWNSELTIRLKKNKANNKTSGWVIDEDGTQAFYFEKLHQTQLPFDYARLVQYVDCMIDTTAQIYFPQATDYDDQPVDKNSKASQFISWAEKFPDRPEYLDYKKIEKLGLNEDSVYRVYEKQHANWDSLRMLGLDAKMKASDYRKNLLIEATDEGVATGNADARLEFYVTRYLSKEYALRAMRSHKVIGNCSMDQRPRYHAMNICKLSAETAQWDIFLRSHLDIMNDRFERRSDGNYAWAGRKTYLKELEELDIPAVDLLLGTSLRIANVSDNHYWGSIGRVGRAMADASDKDELEKRIIAMMQDEKLDMYNRLLMAYLFKNYIANLEDENRKNLSTKKLEDVIKTMPEYIQKVWENK